MTAQSLSWLAYFILGVGSLEVQFKKRRGKCDFDYYSINGFDQDIF